jgi:hypothetical protein
MTRNGQGIPRKALSIELVVARVVFPNTTQVPSFVLLALVVVNQRSPPFLEVAAFISRAVEFSISDRSLSDAFRDWQ